jgi:hypothetical protein
MSELTKDKFNDLLFGKFGFELVYTNNNDINNISKINVNNEIYDVNDKCPNNIDRFLISQDLHYDIVYTIGDIHGDYELLVYILIELKIIIKIKEDNYSWNPELKNTCVVQIGDFLHGYGKRCQNNVYKYFIQKEYAIVKLLKGLIDDLKKPENISKNNNFIVIIGNHEFMNLTSKLNTGKIFYSYDLYNLINMDIIDSDLIIPEIAFIKEEKNINDFIYCYTQFISIINDFIFSHAGIVKEQMRKYFTDYMRFSNTFIENFNDKQKMKLINLISFALLNNIYKQVLKINSNNFDENKKYDNKKISYNEILRNIKYMCFNIIFNKFNIFYFRNTNGNFIKNNINEEIHTLFDNIAKIYLDKNINKQQSINIIDNLIKNCMNDKIMQLKNIESKFNIIFDEYDIIKTLYDKELFLTIYINIINLYDNNNIILQNIYTKKYLGINKKCIQEIQIPSMKMSINDQNFIFKRLNKIQNIFKGKINEFFPYNNIITDIFNSQDFKVLLDNNENKYSGLLSHYFYNIDISYDKKEIKNIGKSNLIDLYGYLNDKNGITATKGLIIGHMPRKEILYVSTIKDNELKKDIKTDEIKFLFNIDNFLSRGQNNCEIIVDKDINNNIILKQPEILKIEKHDNTNIISKIKLSNLFYSEKCYDYINIDKNSYNLPSHLNTQIVI